MFGGECAPVEHLRLVDGQRNPQALLGGGCKVGDDVGQCLPVEACAGPADLDSGSCNGERDGFDRAQRPSDQGVRAVTDLVELRAGLEICAERTEW